MILKPRPFRKPRKGHWATKGLVGCWLFNEGTGNKVYDLSGNGNTGTFGAGVTWAPGKFGSVSVHSASAHEITIPDSPSFDNIDTGFTIIQWIYVTDITDPGRLLDKYGLGGLEFEWGFLNTKLYAWAYDDSGGAEYVGRYVNAVNTYIPNKTWHQVAFVYDGGITSASCKIYIDAIQRDSDDFDSLPGFVSINTSGTEPVKIGGDGGGVGGPFVGMIDHSLFYSRALSAFEVALLCREPFCMFERWPIELWSAATLGAAPPVGMAGAMTLNTGYWGW